MEKEKLNICFDKLASKISINKEKKNFNKEISYISENNSIDLGNVSRKDVEDFLEKNDEWRVVNFTALEKYLKNKTEIERKKLNELKNTLELKNKTKKIIRKIMHTSLFLFFILGLITILGNITELWAFIVMSGFSFMIFRETNVSMYHEISLLQGKILTQEDMLALTQDEQEFLLKSIPLDEIKK